MSHSEIFLVCSWCGKNEQETDSFRVLYKKTEGMSQDGTTICIDCLKTKPREQINGPQCIECGRSSGRWVRVAKTATHGTVIAVGIGWRAWFDPLTGKWMGLCPKHRGDYEE